VKAKAQSGRELTARQRARNRRFGKVRYRGIAKRSAGVLAVSARQSVPGPQDACVRITPDGAARPRATVEATNFAEKSLLQCPGRKIALLRGSLSLVKFALQ
jgi:hypothetical protein